MAREIARRSGADRFKQVAFFCAQGSDANQRVFAELRRICGKPPAAILSVARKGLPRVAHKGGLTDFMSDIGPQRRRGAHRPIVTFRYGDKSWPVTERNSLRMREQPETADTSAGVATAGCRSHLADGRRPVPDQSETETGHGCGLNLCGEWGDQRQWRQKRSGRRARLRPANAMDQLAGSFLLDESQLAPASSSYHGDMRLHQSPVPRFWHAHPVLVRGCLAWLAVSNPSWVTAGINRPERGSRAAPGAGA